VPFWPENSALQKFTHTVSVFGRLDPFRDRVGPTTADRSSRPEGLRLVQVCRRPRARLGF
jgi:hypothetical protein